ncbi:MAG: hypothetical protein KAS64_02815 [Spirochaetes bacterium]|nr:hypothetical protein [Spirochaetota bacterium]
MSLHKYKHKNIITILTLLICVFLFQLLQNKQDLYGINFSPFNFQLPYKDYTSFVNSLSGSGNIYLKNYEYDSGGKLSENRKSLRFSDSLFLSLEKDGPNQYYRVHLQTGAGLGLYSWKQEYTSGTNNSSMQYGSVSIRGENLYRRYLKNQSGLFLSTSQRINYYYNKTYNEIDSVRDIFISTKFFADADAGIGYGRILDLDTYYKAFRILKMIKKEYKLKIKIQDKILQQLTKIIYKQSEYVQKYYKSNILSNSGIYWKKYFYKDIENILKKIAGLKPYLNFFLFKRIEEIINRYYPYKGLGFINTLSLGYNYAYNSQIITEDGQIAGTDHDGYVKFETELSYPISTFFYLNFTGSVSYMLRSSTQAYFFNVALQLAYEVTDSFFIFLNLSIYDFLNDNYYAILNSMERYYRKEIDFILSYTLGNSTSLNISLSFGNYGGTNPYSNIDTDYSFYYKTEIIWRLF